MIDVHAHLFFDELMGEAGTYGPAIQTGPSGHRLVTGGMEWPVSDPSLLAASPASRLDALDDAGIEMQVVSISPLWLFHHAPPEVAERFAGLANNLLSSWCSRTDGRGLGLAQLPTQRPEAAAEELHRCVKDLGMVGGYMGSDARPHLDNEALDPVYQACQDLDVPLFVHSAMPGIDGPPGDPRLDRWTGQAVIGYPLEDTIAASSFLLGSVLDRFPRLDVCLSHAGGGLAMLWGRLSAFARTARSPVTEARLNEHLQRLWFDVHVHSDEADALVRRTLPTDHLVFGSNFGGWDSERPPNHLDPALTSNARRLLRLDRAAGATPPASSSAKHRPPHPMSVQSLPIITTQEVEP
ncbi:amidohydrolase family protein [Aeromicrobium marinum]|nr:amidohydrolase family protein [Aeromicrobium marinum]